MTEQLELFSIPTPTIMYSRKAGSTRGFSLHSAVVYDKDGDPIIGAEIHCRGRAGMKKRTIEAAREAWVHRNARPFGDEYQRGAILVYYLYEG